MLWSTVVTQGYGPAALRGRLRILGSRPRGAALSARGRHARPWEAAPEFRCRTRKISCNTPERRMGKPLRPKDLHLLLRISGAGSQSRCRNYPARGGRRGPRPDRDRRGRRSAVPRAAPRSGRVGRMEDVLGVDDPVGVPLLGEEPLAVLGVVLV